MATGAPIVAHLTSVHQVDDDRIFTKQCRTLAAAGFDVILIGPADADHTVDGVRIKALPVPSGRLGRMTSTVARVLFAAIGSKARICHFHDPELIPIGMLLKLLGRRVIYDVHEDYPQKILDKTWIPGWLRAPLAKAMAAIEACGAWMFDAIATVTPTIEARFPKDKTVRLANFPMLQEFSLDGGIDYARRPMQVAYAGLLAEQRGIHDMIGAAERLEGIDRPLLIAGSFDSESTRAASLAEPGWSRIDHRGWLDRQGVADLLGRARAGLVMMHPVPCYIACYPIKMFEYMAAGLPVIASDFPVFREILDDGRCGLLIPPKDKDALAEAIRWIFEHQAEAEAMGVHGRRRVEQFYTWQAEGEKLIALYQRLAGSAEASSCAY